MAFQVIQVRISNGTVGKPTITTRVLDAATGAFYSTTQNLDGRPAAEYFETALNMARVHFMARQQAQQAADILADQPQVDE